MTNNSPRTPSLLDTLSSLNSALLSSGAAYLAAGVALAAFLLRRHPSAHPLALLLVYGLLLAVDPWQETPGNIRVAAPLLELCFLLAPLLLQSAKAAPRRLRQAATASILAGLVLSAMPAFKHRRSKDRESIRAALDTAGQGHPASTCLMAPDRWPVFRELSAPAFYHRKTYLTPTDPFPTQCQIVVVEQTLDANPPPPFRQVDNLATGHSRWRVCARSEAPAATTAPVSP